MRISIILSFLVFIAACDGGNTRIQFLVSPDDWGTLMIKESPSGSNHTRSEDGAYVFDFRKTPLLFVKSLKCFNLYNSDETIDSDMKIIPTEHVSEAYNLAEDDIVRFYVVARSTNSIEFFMGTRAEFKKNN